MPDRPTGTVTFLFTDIEGSTARWEHHRAAMHAALARHDAILQSTIELQGGQVFKTVGDDAGAGHHVCAGRHDGRLTTSRAIST